jgi:hypothetical protein
VACLEYIGTVLHRNVKKSQMQVRKSGNGLPVWRMCVHDLLGGLPVVQQKVTWVGPSHSVGDCLLVQQPIPIGGITLMY